jgi:hypothetical protein
MIIFYKLSLITQLFRRTFAIPDGILALVNDYEQASKVPVIVLTAKELTPDEERQLCTRADTVIRNGKHNHEKLLDAVNRSAGLNES